MADDDQFSLCWNNFSANLSGGFHEALMRGDLVDVTLSAEGQFVKVHRLVLSVCSPYFREMFQQTPETQHTVVFLKDVSYSSLKDLITFMYLGEVNVKQDALPTFISTAEALQIKGLTDNETAQPQTQTETPAPELPPPTVVHHVPSQRIGRQKTTTGSNSLRYKIDPLVEQEDARASSQVIMHQVSSSPQAQSAPTIINHQQQQQQQGTSSSTSSAQVSGINKRAARSSAASSTNVKRIKSTTDPLDTSEAKSTSATTSTVVQVQTPHISVQAPVISASETKIQSVRQHQQSTSSESEYVMPGSIELQAKSEPDYTDDAQEITGDADGAFGDDDSYIRYDDSYLIDQDEGAAPASTNTGTVASTSKNAKMDTYGDSSFNEGSDQPAGDTQEVDTMPTPAIYETTSRGRQQLIYGGQPFIFEKVQKLSTGQEKKFWRCNQWWNQKCRSRVFTVGDLVTPLYGYHTHEDIVRRKKRTRRNYKCSAAGTRNGNGQSDDCDIKAHIMSGEADAGAVAAALAASSSVGGAARTLHSMHDGSYTLVGGGGGGGGATRATATANAADEDPDDDDELPENIDVSDIAIHLKYEEMVADVDINDPTTILLVEK